MHTKGSRFRDVLLLLASGLIACALLVAGIWLAQKYNINDLWPAAAWATILLIPTVAPTLGNQGQWKKPGFLIFFSVWMLLHGLLVALLIKWVPLLYWLPVICLEGFAGYLGAYFLFGMLPPSDQGT